jgi:hypothetical protein
MSDTAVSGPDFLAAMAVVRPRLLVRGPQRLERAAEGDHGLPLWMLVTTVTGVHTSGCSVSAR